MKKFILTLLFIIFCFTAKSQIDISYNGIVKLNSSNTKDIIYTKILHKAEDLNYDLSIGSQQTGVLVYDLNFTYNPPDSILYSNRKGLTYDSTFNVFKGAKISFSLKLNIKDGEYKYDFYNFVCFQKSITDILTPDFILVNTRTDKVFKVAYAKEKEWQAFYKNLLSATKKETEIIIESLK